MKIGRLWVFYPIGLLGGLPALAQEQQLDCPPRAAPDARMFDPSSFMTLVGTYDFTVMSTWESSNGQQLHGVLELWPTDSLRRYHDPEYLRLEDSPEGWARYDYDSIIAWYSGVDRPLSGSTDVDFRELNAPDDTVRASGDPNHPLVVWQWNRLDFAPTRFGFVTLDRAFPYAEVEGYSSTGFWGRWDSSLGTLALVDDDGNKLPNPNGVYCARRRGSL